MLIAHALDSIYEIFADNNYDEVLKENEIIKQMQDGGQALMGLFEQQKKAKVLGKHELDNAENMVLNLEGFCEYKIAEFKK